MKECAIGVLIVGILVVAFVAMNCSSFGPIKFCYFH